MARRLASPAPAAKDLRFDGRVITLSNPDKVLYPVGFTKAQVLDYYLRVAKFILPHLKDRPVTLKRYPNGVAGEFFYEKRAPSFTPEWVKTFPVPRRDGGAPKRNTRNLLFLRWPSRSRRGGFFSTGVRIRNTKLR